MKIAFTQTAGKGQLDPVLAELAARLEKAGVHTCGVVQINTDRDDCRGCDMDVKILPQGPVFRISQDLGKNARGCRLDSEALELAVARSDQVLKSGAQVFILNKFGKQEAAGRGFRDLIAEAIAADIPVIVGVNGLNLNAFMEFTGGEGVAVEPDPASLETWLKGHLDLAA